MIAVMLIVLACAAAAFVLAPLMRPETAPTWEAERDRLIQARETAYRALRDLEMDRATGKIGDADYQTFRARCEGDAVAVLHRLDALAASLPNSGADPVGGGST